MKAYIAILKTRAQVLFQYRAAALAGLTTQVFWGWVRVMIFAAFFASTDSQQPMTYEQVVTYIWLSQAFFALIPWTGDSEIREMIHTGHVAYELLRPVDLYGFWFMRAVAARAVPSAMRAAPLIVVAGSFLGLQAPSSPLSLVASLVSIFLSVLITASIAILLTISLLWTISGEGINRITPPMVFLLSGNIVPLAFFPSWLQEIIGVLPFRAITDTPIRFYLGLIPPERLLNEVAFGLVWIVALVSVGRFALARGTRKLVIQGG